MWKDVKIAIIIPTRGDRTEFFDNCIRLMQKQTLKPNETNVISYEPTSESCDITQRYRIGYSYYKNNRASASRNDLIAFIEDDDWYSPIYLETMAKKWLELGKPDILGTNYTIYYHLGLLSYFTMHHESRSSAMSTLIKPGLDFKWCPDNEPYTDVHLWNTIRGKIFKPDSHICLGMKHGIGLCGGRSHVDRLERYKGADNNGEWLKSIVEEEDFDFYHNVHLLLNKTST